MEGNQRDILSQEVIVFHRRRRDGDYVANSHAQVAGTPNPEAVADKLSGPQDDIASSLVNLTRYGLRVHMVLFTF